MGGDGATKKPMAGADGFMAAQASTARGLGLRASDPKSSSVAFPQNFFFGCDAGAFDPGRYETLAPDKDGVIVFPSLIPGAPYR